jgi:uncharacterized protein
MSGRRLAGLVLVVALAACSSPNPVLYTIAPVQGRVQTSGPKVIAIQQISIPRYLERSQIVRSSENYRLDVMSNDWWGESLGGMLGRVLVLELSQRLPASTVYGESGAIAVDHNVMVGVNIQRLDADKAGKLILIAQVAAEFNRPRRMAARTFTLSRPLATQDTPGLVAAISDAMGELADGIAALLQP